MDVVITYVDGKDPLWIEDYGKTVGKDFIAKRYRDWGTLRFLFRGIEKNMPYVRKVHLVVARESQVPEWVNRDTVHIVLHSDIIPEEHLPLFNSASIEMFLHRIEGLDEEFVYLNDDFFPINNCPRETFFENGKPVIGMSHHLIAHNSYKQHTKTSDLYARKFAGKHKSPVFIRPQHIAYNLLRSVCEEVYETNREEILSRISPLRQDYNFNIYLFLDYIHYMKRSVNKHISRVHISLGPASPERLKRYLQSPKAKIACINDVEMSDERFNQLHEAIIEGFHHLLPEKSKFEV